MSGPPPLRVQQSDEQYQRDLAAEAAFWDQPQLYSLDAYRPVIDPYVSQRFTGDENVGCFETIDRYGTFTRGCSFGTGAFKDEAAILERNPSLHLTFYDISAESLADRAQRLGERFPGRVAVQRMDLNFVDLPENAYDLIVSSGCVHHLINLEYVAYQINRTLTPNGYFFLYDYVGATRFQFPAQEKRFFEAAIDYARRKHPVLKRWRVGWSDLDSWEHSPFEAIHSDESLSIFREHLKEVSLRPGGSLIWMLLWLRAADVQPAPNLLRRLRYASPFHERSIFDNLPDHTDVFREVAPDLLWLDTALTDTGLFKPWDAFAVYQKRSTS